ncbi:50S ribosomal protein L6 [Candidatus Pacearchaeota archaeon]|nr:50S ribosomal protein L6 [Candidatus Pacearchaeota archaeon]
MKKEIIQKIEIPEGVEANIEENKLIVKGEKGENEREFRVGKLDFEKKDNLIIIGAKKATKNEKKMINTFAAHIKNMLKGIKEGFEYKLKICSSHFPMTVDIQGNDATVKNFVGEKIPRKLKIPKNVEVDIKGEIITITSNDKESAGQAAANFEKATKIRNKDRRVFQDGIFITSKAGRDM